MDFNITEELLTLQPLKGTTTGEDIFEAVNTVFRSFVLKWHLPSGICTGEAPAMVGARFSADLSNLYEKLGTC